MKTTMYKLMSMKAE